MPARAKAVSSNFIMVHLSATGHSRALCFSGGQVGRRLWIEQRLTVIQTTHQAFLQIGCSTRR
jgi:hypothetical protein